MTSDRRARAKSLTRRREQRLQKRKENRPSQAVRRPSVTASSELPGPGSATGTPSELADTVDKAKGRKPIAVKTLEPDIPAPWSIDDLLKARDPGMAAVQAALAGQHG